MLGGTAPSYLSACLTLNNHSHNNRSSQSSLVIPHHGTYGKSAFCITGAKLWNSLPASIKCSPSLVNFKKRVVFYMTNWFQSSRVNLSGTSQLLMFYRFYFYFCIRTLLWFLLYIFIILLFIVFILYIHFYYLTNVFNKKKSILLYHKIFI